MRHAGIRGRIRQHDGRRGADVAGLPNLQSRGDRVPGSRPSDLARRPGDEDRRYASAAFLGSLLPPSELFFSDFSDDLPSLDPSDLLSDPAFFRRP